MFAWAQFRFDVPLLGVHDTVLMKLVPYYTHGQARVSASR
jgi:hypothetical protein